MKKYVIVVIILLSLFIVYFNFHAEDNTVIFRQSPNISIHEGGALEVQINNNIYVLESKFSAAGSESIIWYEFGKKPDLKWNISIEKNDNNILITAKGLDYIVNRNIIFKKDKISIQDTIENLKFEESGVIIRNTFKDDHFVGDLIVSGEGVSPNDYNPADILRKKSAENPTTLIKKSDSALGFVTEKSFDRYNFNVFLHDDDVTIENKHSIVKGKSEIKNEYTLYLYNTNKGYYDFVNDLRKESLTSPIAGGFDFFNIIENKALLEDKNILKRYLEHRNIGILALTPWLDYDNFNISTNSVIGREEYRNLYANAYKVIKEVDPSVKLIGLIQSNLVSLPPDVANNILSQKKKDGEIVSGIRPLSRKETSLLKSSNLPWADNEIITNSDGTYTAEIYFNGKQKVPLIALAVFAGHKSYQSKYLQDQINFLLDDVSLDGVYIDQFNLSFPEDSFQRYSFSGWDGSSALINQDTGKIDRKYKDAGFSSIKERVKIIDYLLSRNAVVVLNTYPASAEMESYPTVMRFGEAFWPFYASKGWEAHGIPNYSALVVKGHLTTPIALSTPHWLGVDNENVLFKNIIFNLRHGLLTYFNGSYNQNSNEKYSNMNDIFPIDVVEIGEGYVLGKSKVITAVSKTFIINKKQMPKLFIYNQDKIVNKKIDSRRLPDNQWEVRVKIDNWNEIAIIK
jgi:hypothetical protein